jgi:glycosyltransferase involved in cell wall biosynthesis
MSKKIVWFVSTLDQAGGGDRLLFETKASLWNCGVEVTVLTWKFNEAALFNGKYGTDGVKNIGNKLTDNCSIGILGKVFSRVAILFESYKQIKTLKPDFLVCQSEYEAVLVSFLSFLTKTPYIVKIFGQSYLEALEPAKFLFPFKKHLKEIRNSLPIYKETIPLKRPKFGFTIYTIYQIVCILRYFAIRNARFLFTLSPQCKYEVETLYGVEPILLRSGFRSDLLDYKNRNKVKAKHSIASDTKVITCFSRLLPKKRIDVAIRAFAKVSSTHSKLFMFVCGTGPELNSLKLLASELNLDKIICFTGYVHEDDVEDYIGESDMLVNLDVAQFDIVALESIALGTKIIGLRDHEFSETFIRANCIEGSDPSPEGVAVSIEKTLQNSEIKITPEFTKELQELTWDAYGKSFHDYVYGERK